MQLLLLVFCLQGIAITASTPRLTDFKRIIEIERHLVKNYKAAKYCTNNGCLPESAGSLMAERKALIEKYPEFKEKFSDFSQFDPETYK